MKVVLQRAGVKFQIIPVPGTNLAFGQLLIVLS